MENYINFQEIFTKNNIGVNTRKFTNLMQKN